MRTSSATNSGEDKDSIPRQLTAIRSFAERAGFEVVSEHYDPAVRKRRLTPTLHPVRTV
jgi:DNA-binding FrmR family transcriptional regulator